MEGYKPLFHKACDNQVAWIKREVLPSMRARSADVLLMDGTQPEPYHKIFDCPHCGLAMHAYSMWVVDLDRLDIEL